MGGVNWDDCLGDAGWWRKMVREGNITAGVGGGVQLRPRQKGPTKTRVDPP